MNICLLTFGCQMNRLDSELVRESLTAAGHNVTTGEDNADVILYNTCSVRDHAEQRVLSRMQQNVVRKKKHPHLLLGMLGCFAQRMGHLLLDKIPQLDLVIGTHQFTRIAEWIEQAAAGPVIAVEMCEEIGQGVRDAHARPTHNGWQGYVSIMRGCNNFCSYCIVPYVRGREVSRTIPSVLDEIRALEDKGVKEVTLLGQNVDAYGKDINSTLSELLNRVHDSISSIIRIRFVTSHPRDITETLIRTVNQLPKIAKHLHMPAQSGSTEILERMRRGYTRSEYDEKLKMIHELSPDMLVASDFIVGFSGETESHFAETLDLVKKAKFQNSFIFKYSPRPGTASASDYADDVPSAEKAKRNYALLAAQNEVNLERGKSLVGASLRILAEGRSTRDASRMIGRTGTNLICVFDASPNDDNLIGSEVDVKVVSYSALTLFCEKVK